MLPELGIVAFTPSGKQLAERIAELFSDEYRIIRCSGDLSPWCRERFEEGTACLLFIGACGIAVRTIAPYLKHKYVDPAVLVMDEAAQFVIPVLSGHVGGANDWARRLSELTGAQPVITTATDVRDRYAADVFAVRNGLIIGSPDAVKTVSMAVLEGRPVGIFSEVPLAGILPEGLSMVQAGTAEEAASLWKGPLVLITELAAENTEPGRVLNLFPRQIVLGIGCRKGKTCADLEQASMQALQRSGIDRRQVCGIASIDLKKEEQGLKELAEKWKVPFQTFCAEELRGVKGAAASSPFVEQVTGVDNVCERAALAMAGDGGRLVLEKQAGDGITVAAAVKRWGAAF